MDIGMAAESRQTIGEGLNGLLADLYATYVMTQNLHWNLTGKEFFSLHVMLEKQYEGLAEIVDEVAERVRALGLYVNGSLDCFQKHCTIKECKQVLTASDGLQHLLQALGVVVKRARTLGNMADEKSDHATVDLIGRLLNHLEKSAWMVRSSL
ncbi:MAG: DNA starvation/stationary phase protection protein [Simkania sp.]|nr:DNA starvation/stationary phase protection protein [Simkania sp.]